MPLRLESVSRAEGGKPFMQSYLMSGSEMKQLLQNEYCTSQRTRVKCQREKKKRNKFRNTCWNNHSALFLRLFADGNTEVCVYTDKGLDSSILCHAILELIIKLQSNLKVWPMKKPVTHRDVSGSVCLPHKKSASLEFYLMVRHALNFMLRNIEWYMLSKKYMWQELVA